MMSASEGEGGHGRAEVVGLGRLRELNTINQFQMRTSGGGGKQILKFWGHHLWMPLISSQDGGEMNRSLKAQLRNSVSPSVAVAVGPTAPTPFHFPRPNRSEIVTNYGAVAAFIQDTSLAEVFKRDSFPLF